MAPDFDMLTGDVLMGDAVKQEVITPDNFVAQTVQRASNIVKSNSVTIKHVPQKKIQLSEIKSPEKLGHIEYIQPNVTADQPPRPKIKILKKINMGTGAAQNIAIKLNEPVAKDTAGTIVVNKAYGNFSGKRSFWQRKHALLGSH